MKNIEEVLVKREHQLGDPAGKHCGTCVHFNPHTPSNVVNVERKNYGSWCAKLSITTAAEMLRCGGGSDYEERKR